MLKLSDADLARLRFDCWRHAMELKRTEISRSVDLCMEADRLLAWCLRDREPEGE